MFDDDLGSLSVRIPWLEHWGLKLCHAIDKIRPFYKKHLMILQWTGGIPGGAGVIDERLG